MAHVRHLAQIIGPRVAGSVQERQAITYVMGQLSEMGYTPRQQAVSLWNKMSSCNVIATVPGNQRIVIVGAHLDSVAGSPGANDNASGVAVLLELARHLSHHRPVPTVHVVAFCAEEGQYKNGHSVEGTGRRGSAVYVKSLSEETRSRVVAMINMDMVGAGPRRLDIGDMSTEGQPPALRCLEPAHQMGIPAEFGQFGGKSDYRPFSDAGIPIVALAWGNDPSHHTAADSVSIVDSGKLEDSLGVIASYIGTIQ